MVHARELVRAVVLDGPLSRTLVLRRALICAVLGGALPGTTSAQELFVDSAAVRQLKEAARAQNAGIVARRAALDAARSRLRAAGFGPAAMLSAEMEVVPNGRAVGSAGSIRADLSREFLSGALRSARRGIAERDVERAQAELELAERSVGARVDRALTLAIGALAIARRFAAEDSLLASAEEGVRTRFAIGEARYVDVLRLRTERLRVQTDAAAALTEARIRRQTLFALLAESPDIGSTAIVVDSAITRELRDPLRIPLPAAPALDSLIALSSAARLCSIAVARAQASRRLTRAEQRPTIIASIGAQRFARDAGGSTVGPTIGASVSLPFTARRGNQAAITAADRGIAAAEASRQAAIASVRAESTAAYQRYEAARERLLLFDAALLRGAREERESALAAYRSGELSLVELLDFERALARAEIARLRSRMDAADALADLIAGATDESDGSHTAFTLPPGGDR
ncbi:MAG: TolC family protein [Gemmatimonadaceae bacterium]